MSKVATKPVSSKGAAAKAPAAARRTAAAGRPAAVSGGSDELSALALANKELEDVERAKTGNSNNFISLVTARSQVLDKNNPNFMKGVKPLDYVVTSKKTPLGAKIDVTILGMFKLYAEVTKKEKESDMPKTVRFWMPGDAAQFPVPPGGIFDRELPNGNTLQPNHWVFVYLHDHPEIEDGLIAFRSKGNSIYSRLEKLIKTESSVVTELRFEVSSQEIYNEKFKKTDYYPKFELTGRNYRLTEDGKVVKTKDSDLDADTLKEILVRSHKAQEDYAQMKMVAKQDVQAIAGVPGRPALPAGKGGYEDDEGDEGVTF